MFNIGKWLGQLMETKSTYFQLKRYVEDKDALSVYRQNLYAVSISEEDELLTISEGEILETIRAKSNNQLNDALEHYTSLMVVTAATYIENMFSEFLYETFVAHPASMYDYIADEDAKAKGYVKLTEILAEPDMNALIARLSRRASTTASNGSARKVMERIAKLSNRPFDISIADRAQAIMDKRNQIVHEGRQFWINEIDIDATYDTLHALLQELGLACISGKIPYSDPAFIIDPMPEFVNTAGDNLLSG